MISDQPTIGQSIQKEEPKKIGRPIAITLEVESKLEEVLRLGVSDKSACAYAQISRDTFYLKIKEDERFSDKMQQARDYAVIASRNLIIKTILDPKEDKLVKLETSKWYLENHELRNKGNTQQTQVNVFSQLREQYTIKTETDNTKETIITPAQNEQT